MDADLEGIVAQARERIAAVSEEAQLADAKAAFLGRSGALTTLMKSLGTLSGEAKAQRGQALNQVKQRIETLLNQRGKANQVPPTSGLLGPVSLRPQAVVVAELTPSR